MRSLHAAAAMWVCRRICGDDDRCVLIGDLLEEYVAGRGRRWLWRQVLAAAVLTVPSAIGRQRLAVASAVGAGLLALPLFQYVAALLASTSMLGLRSFVAGVLAAWVMTRIARRAGYAAVVVFATFYMGVVVPWVLVAAVWLGPEQSLSHLAVQAVAIATTLTGLLVGGVCSSKAAPARLPA